MMVGNKLLKVFMVLMLLVLPLLAQETPMQLKDKNAISGKILWRDDDLIFINVGRAHGVQPEAVFKVFSKRGREIGVIEVVTVLEDNLSMCKAYMQITKMRKGFRVELDTGMDRNALQRKLNIVIRREDQIKKVTGFIEDLGEDKNKIDVDAYVDTIAIKIFSRGLDALKVRIPKLRDPKSVELIKKEFRVSDLVKLFKKEIVFNGKDFNIYYEGEVNLTRLVNELKRNGYTLSPKRLVMEFPKDVERPVISEILKRIYKNSKYIARDIIDLESPIPIIVFTVPQTLALEISDMEFGSYKIYISRIYEDTLIFKVITPLLKEGTTVMDLEIE